MGARFLIGLTDVESDAFYPAFVEQNSYNGPTAQIEKHVYILQKNDTTVEKATIEWELNTSLPAVTNLLNVLDIIKSKMNITQIHYHKYSQILPGLFDTDFYVEIKNLIPNVGLTFPKYTEIDYENISTDDTPVYCSLELDGTISYISSNINEEETLFYAMYENNVSFLKNGPLDRIVYPGFRINFRHNTNTDPNKSMSIEQQQWMIANQDALESKGYYINDSKNKIGSLVIGQVIGTYDDAFAKAQQYNRICRVEIIKD